MITLAVTEKAFVYHLKFGFITDVINDAKQTNKQKNKRTNKQTNKQQTPTVLEKGVRWGGGGGVLLL